MPIGFLKAPLLLLSLLLLPMLVTASCGKGSGAAKAPAGPVTVRFWQPFGGDGAKAMHEIAEEFERTHPGIHVEVAFAANNLSASQKLFLAIAGGEAPDVTLVDGQQLAEWAARGALTDVTDQVRKSGLTGDDFFLPRWKESMFAGRVYALPWGADPNFAFCWNKKAFREAGLDPERPPRTIEELDEYDAKLTKTDDKGRLVQVGFVPWPFGLDNGMFTWGYVFGGDFYLPPGDPGIAALTDLGEVPELPYGLVTANNPKNVEALRWLQRFGQRHDIRKLSAFQASFVGLANDPFRLGNQAMCLLHVTQLRDIKRYAPSLEYGVGAIPAPPGGEYPSGWIGGWSVAIPRGVAATDEAFEFMRWMCTSPAATMKMGVAISQFPAYRKSPFYQSIQGKPDQEAFYEILKNAKHVRTLMPVQGYLMDLLNRASNEVLYGGRDPQAALDEVTAKAQERLEYVMARAQVRPEAPGHPDQPGAMETAPESRTGILPVPIPQSP
jgi:ABC-type glycerol-3-phosphate transport system substrate-binding protein